MAAFLPIRHVRYLCTVVTTTATTAAASTISVSNAKPNPNDPIDAPEIYSPVSDRFTERSGEEPRRVPDIESLIESHKKDPRITHEPYLSTLIQYYGLAGLFDHALKTYNEMDELGTPRSVMSFNALLSSCYQSKLFDQVPNLFSELPQKFNFVPNEISYGILVKSFCKLGSPEKAITTLREMVESKIEISAITFTPVLDALYKKGESEEAEKLWKEMESKGYSPDVATYNVRLMYAHVGQLENVKALIEEMSDAGVKPNTVSYNYLMTCYCRSEMMEEAKKVYEGLGDNGCHPNVETFRTLTFHLCRTGDFEEGYKVFMKSVELHKLPQFRTMRHLLEGLVKISKREEAKELIQMVKKEFPSNFLYYWKELEEQLGLASAADAPAPTETKETAV